MKKIFLLITAFIISMTIYGQQRWTVSHQKMVILKNVEEAPESNTITLSKSSLSQEGNLTFTFKINDGTVNRTLMVDDSSRAGIKSWENSKKTTSISNAELKKLFSGRTKLLFYFTEIPKDPAKAAVVRIRPVHLCTLVLK